MAAATSSWALRSRVSRAGDLGPLLVDRRLKPVGVPGDLRLHLAHELLLPLPDARELIRQPALEVREIARPVGHPCLDIGLRLRQCSGQALGRGALALGDVAPPLLGDTALVLGEGG